MRSAVYNRYWRTGGGAETYGAALAQLLARRGPVTLLAHEEFDKDALAERLALDLSGCDVRTVPHASAAVTRASAEVDLFVNVSHRSRDAGAAARNLYVVHFPTSLGAAGPPSTAVPRVERGTGFHLPEGRVTWTDGEAELHVHTDREVELTVLLGRGRPAPTQVRLCEGDRELARTRLDGGFGPLERWSGRPLRARVSGSTTLTLTSEVFVPGGTDERTLGVPVTGIALGAVSSGWAARLRRTPPAPPGSMRWLDSYDAVVANSAFTQAWVRRLWQRESAVLHPPVSLRAAGTKDRVLLGVGRFFPQGGGHSKKQVELVRAFRALHDGGGADGWELHLAGGCAPAGRDYLEQVRREAAGLPVHLHVDASGAELDALYARASVFWHLAGLGEDREQHPERLEHFGISTVEAMSAGAVPVVLRAGGLTETVRDGLDGVHVDDVDGLVAQTRVLLGDPARLAAMGEQARHRAEQFSLEAFDARLEQLLHP